MIVFPDTNFFLHHQDPAAIPWAQITGDDHIRLVICRNTARELDKKKFELQGRPQKRARKYAAVIAEVVETKQPVELRAADPRVTLEMAPPRPGAWAVPPDLEAPFILGDDAFVADVLHFRDVIGEDCTVLTADSGPLEKAAGHGLPVVRTTRPGWQLPDEPDTRDKRIKELERRLEEMEGDGPAIAVEVRLQDAPARVVPLDVVRYPVLAEERVEALLAELQARHPRVVEFPRPTEADEKDPFTPAAGQPFDLAELEGPFDWVGPTEKQLATYNTAYDTWLEEARALIDNLPKQRQRPEFEASFKFCLENVGVAAAEGVRVSLEATAGLLLKDLDDGPKKKAAGKANAVAQPVPTSLRPPPKAPGWRKIYREVAQPTPDTVKPNRTMSVLEAMRIAEAGGAYGSALAEHERMQKIMRDAGLGPLPGMPGLHGSEMLSGLGYRSPMEELRVPVDSLFPRQPKPRDPEDFYWRGGAPVRLQARWDLECELLRHHVQPRVWTQAVVARLDRLPGNGGSIRVEVHARNLKRPFTRDVPVRISVRDEDTEALVRAALFGPSTG